MACRVGEGIFPAVTAVLMDMMRLNMLLEESWSIMVESGRARVFVARPCAFCDRSAGRCGRALTTVCKH